MSRQREIKGKLNDTDGFFAFLKHNILPPQENFNKKKGKEKEEKKSTLV